MKGFDHSPILLEYAAKILPNHMTLMEEYGENQRKMLIRPKDTSLSGKAKHNATASFLQSRYYDSSIHSLYAFGDLSINQYDYPGIVYPIPFSDLYHQYNMRYKNYGGQLKGNMSFLLTGDIMEAELNNVLLVTGASHNHALVSFNCFYSLALADVTASLLYINYGLSSEDELELFRVFSLVHMYHTRHFSSARVYYRVFDFSHFPAWMNIENANTGGGYAWKVIGYMDALLQYKGMMGWIDGGSLLVDGIQKELMYARREGMYSPVSSGTLHHWVHQDTFRFLEEYGMIHEVNRKALICSGGHVFVDYRNQTILHSLFYPFLQCIYTEMCVSPHGSSRYNHRQDQAVLSIFIQNSHLLYSSNKKYYHIARIHNEDRSKKDLEEERNRLLRLLQK